MKKFLGIVLLFFLWQTPSNSSDKIYCMTVTPETNWKAEKRYSFYTVYEIKRPKPSSTCNESKSQWNRKNLIEVSKDFYENGPFIGTNIPKKIKSEDFDKVRKKFGLDKAIRTATGKEFCKDYLDWSWSISSNTVTLRLTNQDNKPMEISGLAFYTDGDKHITTSKLDVYVKPFGKLSRKIVLEDLNTDVIKTASLFCNVLSKEKKNISKKSKKESNSIWTIIAWIIGIGFIAFVGYGWYDAQNPNRNKSKTINQKPTEKKETSKQAGENIISKVWEGNDSMARIFWIYCILVVAIVSFISGLVLYQFGNLIFLIPIIVIIWSNTGLWRSSEKYKNQKLQNKQPYGWATAAKFYVVLNYITTLSQIGLNINS